MDKPQIRLSVTPDAVSLMDRIGTALGITRAAVLELAVRDMAKEKLPGTQPAR